MIMSDNLKQGYENLSRIRPNKIIAAEKEIRRFFRGPNPEERVALMERIEMVAESEGSKRLVVSADEAIHLAFLLPGICKKDTRLLEYVLPLLDGFWGNSWMEAFKAYVTFYDPENVFYADKSDTLTLAKCLLKEYAWEKEETDNSPDPEYIKLLQGGHRWLADVLARNGVDRALGAMGLGEEGWLDAKTLENSGMYKAAVLSYFEGTNSVDMQCAVFRHLVEKEDTREDFSRKKQLQEFLNQWISVYAKREETDKVKQILDFISDNMQEYLRLFDDVKLLVDSAMELENGPDSQKSDELLGKLRSAEGLPAEQRKSLFSRHDAKLLAFLIPRVCRREPGLLDEMLPYINCFGGNSWREAVKAYIMFYQPDPPFYSSKKTDKTLAGKLLDFSNSSGEDISRVTHSAYLSLLRFGASKLKNEIINKGVNNAFKDMGLVSQGGLQRYEIESSRLYQEAIRHPYKRDYLYDEQRKMFERLLELEESRNDPSKWGKLRSIVDSWIELHANAKKAEKIIDIMKFLNLMKRRTNEELREYLTPSDRVRAMADVAMGDSAIEEDTKSQLMVSGDSKGYSPRLAVETVTMQAAHRISENVEREAALPEQEAVRAAEPQRGLLGKMCSFMNKFKKLLGFSVHFSIK